ITHSKSQVTCRRDPLVSPATCDLRLAIKRNRCLIDQPSNLQKVQLNWGFATKERHQHTNSPALVIDRIHNTLEVGERPIGDLDRLTDLVADANLGRLLLHLFEDRLDLAVVQRCWAVAMAYKARHTGGIAHDIP